MTVAAVSCMRASAVWPWASSMGSAAYAAELRRAAVEVHAMILLEMLGHYSDRPHSQRYPPGLSLSLRAPEWTVVVGLSDHSSFWKGAPGLMVTDTTFMRNPHYHQASDTADTLDFDRFAQVTRGLVGAVQRLGSTIE